MSAIKLLSTVFRSLTKVNQIKIRRMYNRKLWLDFYETPVGNHCLREFHSAYQDLPENPIEVILFIRNNQHLANGIYLHSLPSSQIIVIECNLYTFTNLTRSRDHIYIQSIISFYSIPKKTLVETSRLLYTNAFLNFTTTILFFEMEFESLSTIIRELASWALLNTDIHRQRPRVIITTTRMKPTKELEWQLTVEILTNFNPLKEYSFKTAQQCWHRCFESISHVKELRLYDIRNLALGKRPNIFYPENPKHLFKLFQQYFQCFTETQQPSLLQLVAQLHPLPVFNNLPIFSLRKDTIKVNAFNKLIASTFVLDAFNRSLFHFPIVDVFEEFYAQLIKNYTQRTNIFQQVKNHFMNFARIILNTQKYVLQHQSVIKNTYCYLDNNTFCPSCIIYYSTCYLSCGHGLCNACTILHYQKPNQNTHSIRCFICGSINDTPLHVIPYTTGFRVLYLGGPIETASTIANTLRSLYRLLGSPLRNYFDKIVAHGIGIFFAIMLFSKNGTIEDCIYHLPKVKYIKEKQQGIKFGSNLYFKYTEMTTNGVYLCLKHHEGMRIQRNEDTITNIHIPIQQPIKTIANRLLASLFYVELDDPFCSQYYTTFVIKCRLPPGPHLMDILVRARRQNSYIKFQGQSYVLCPEDTWQQVLNGKIFARRVSFTINSTSTVIDIQITGLVSEPTFLTDDPYTLNKILSKALLNQSSQQQKKSRAEKMLDYMDLCLGQFT